MKNLRNSLIASLIVIITVYSQEKTSKPIGQKEKDCLTLKYFSLLKNYICSNGKIIKPHIGAKGKRSKNGMAEINTGALEISLNDRYLTLTNYQDHQKLIIVNNNKDQNIEPYFISNRDNKLKISAYYSRLDTKENIKARKQDWCNLIEELKLLMKLPKNCE